MDTKSVVLFVFGMAIGLLMPTLPEPLTVIDPYLPYLFIIVGLFFLIKN